MALYEGRKTYFSLWLVHCFTDLMALGIVVTQWRLMDLFTKNELYNGLFNAFEVLAAVPQERKDPLIFIFPYLATCTVEGWSRTTNYHTDTFTCVLPQNDGYEKLFVINYLFLLVVGSISILQIVMLCFKPSHRKTPLNISNLELVYFVSPQILMLFLMI